MIFLSAPDSLLYISGFFDSAQRQRCGKCVNTAPTTTTSDARRKIFARFLPVAPKKMRQRRRCCCVFKPRWQSFGHQLTKKAVRSKNVRELCRLTSMSILCNASLDLE
jgi:hypothetical protein